MAQIVRRVRYNMLFDIFKRLDRAPSNVGLRSRSWHWDLTFIGTDFAARLDDLVAEPTELVARRIMDRHVNPHASS